MIVTGLLLAAVFAAAVLRGLTGFGFAMAAVPVMSLVVAPARAVAIAIVLQCLIGMRDVVAMHRLLDRRALALLTLGAVVGTPVGIWGLTHLPADTMRVVLAVLVGCGFLALLTKLRLPDGPGPALGAGLVAGLFSGLAAMPGPPAIAYFLGRTQAADRTRASLMVFFFLTSLLALPGLFWAGELTREAVLTAVLALPVLLLGTWAGSLGFHRLGDGGYRTVALILLAAMAVLTGARGLSGMT
ncbi:sulfite exporter TauE/SafE family protein [Falsirhodobacter algicola]|uniref:Probable membrane transporter protein n=1 Tax=Falsirhodobacter algicola TaxID=2692330 RepID=A0A8J8MTT9_9RHOB|nr:sulfite exporter TauE/SafE family protein [Falsirhodobacter algicola]QUS36319.1 TSUP family transporter [Falsirhodobacter algicola]